MRSVIAWLCGAVGLLGVGAGAAFGAELEVGDVAPDFELQGSDGHSYRLVEILDESGTDGVVLSWFPKAFTGG